MSESNEQKRFSFRALRISFLLILGILLLSSTAEKPAWGFELKVTNATNAEIYPTVICEKSKERFGVVAAGKSKTVGFSPFRIGGTIQISWEEGESYDLTSVFIDSSNLKMIQSQIESVHLIYNGKGTWILKAFDKNDKLIGSVP